MKISKKSNFYISNVNIFSLYIRKYGPNRFSRFDVYCIQTDKQSIFIIEFFSIFVLFSNMQKIHKKSIDIAKWKILEKRNEKSLLNFLAYVGFGT